MESMIPVGDKSKSSSSSSSSIGRDRLAEGRLLAGEREEDPVEASELELAGGATAGRTRELTDGGSFAWSTISTFESACATWPEFVILI